MLQPAKKCGLARTFIATTQCRANAEFLARAKRARRKSHSHSRRLRNFTVLFFWLPNASNLATMLAKCKFLQQVGDVLARRHETHLDLAVRTYRSDATEQAQ